MIIKGSNSPLILIVKNIVGEIENLSVSLFNAEHKELKNWLIDDVVIKDNNIICPLTQEETLSFDSGLCKVELKILNIEGAILNSKVKRLYIQERSDMNILGNDIAYTDIKCVPELDVKIVPCIPEDEPNEIPNESEIESDDNNQNESEGEDD